MSKFLEQNFLNMYKLPKFTKIFLRSKSLQSLFKINLVQARCYSSKSGQSQMKVTVIGAAGRTGQPTCLMLKQSPLIDELALVDIAGTCGFGLELGHIDTKANVYAYSSLDSLPESLEGAKVVVYMAAASGITNKAFDDQFKANAGIAKEFAAEFGKYCPSALLAVVTHPVNSIVPVISEALKKISKYNPNKIFGVTSLHSVRANTFAGDVLGLEPECINIQVLGGAQDRTIVPILSQTAPCADFSLAELQLLTSKIQMAHREIINVKANDASTLAAAYAISRFVISLIKGYLGNTDVVECAYVKSIVHPHTKYLATPLQLGPGGIQKNLGIPEITEFEKCLLETAIQEIKKDVAKADKYMGVRDSTGCNVCDSDPKAKTCPKDHCRKRTLYD